MDVIQKHLGFILEMNFAVPINQILLFVLIGSLCLLLGKHKVGLLISYGFVFYWGFILNRGYFMKELEQTQIGVYAYGVMGFMMGVIAFVGFIKKSE